jgi:hypothetical protein
LNRRNVNAAEVELRGARRNELIEQILQSAGERATETRDWAGECEVLNRGWSDEATAAQQRGGASGAYATATQQLRVSLPKLARLGHEVEVVLRPDRVIQRLGLDLDRLFAPIRHQLSPGVFLLLEQHGRAVLRYESGPDCLVAAPGHMAVSVPIRLTAAGEVLDFSGNVTFAIRTVDPSFRYYQLIATRRAHLCGAEGLNRVLAEVVVDRFNQAMAQLDGRPLDVGSIPNMGVGSPDPYAGMFGVLIRLHYGLHPRPREPVSPITVLPDWADTGVKFSPASMRKIIEDKVADAGFRGPRIEHPAVNVIDVHCSRTDFAGIRVLKIDFGVRVTLFAHCRCQLRITPTRNLEAVFHVVHLRSEVEVQPFDPSLGIVNELIEELVDHLAGAIRPLFSETQVFPLPANLRAEVSGTGEGVVVLLATLP